MVNKHLMDSRPDSSASTASSITSTTYKTTTIKCEPPESPSSGAENSVGDPDTEFISVPTSPSAVVGMGVDYPGSPYNSGSEYPMSRSPEEGDHDGSPPPPQGSNSRLSFTSSLNLSHSQQGGGGGGGGGSGGSGGSGGGGGGAAVAPAAVNCWTRRPSSTAWCAATRPAAGTTGRSPARAARASSSAASASSSTTSAGRTRSAR